MRYKVQLLVALLSLYGKVRDDASCRAGACWRGRWRFASSTKVARRWCKRMFVSCLFSVNAFSLALQRRLNGAPAGSSKPIRCRLPPLRNTFRTPVHAWCCPCCPPPPPPPKKRISSGGSRYATACAPLSCSQKASADCTGGNNLLSSNKLPGSSTPSRTCQPLEIHCSSTAPADLFSVTTPSAVSYVMCLIPRLRCRLTGAVGFRRRPASPFSGRIHWYCNPIRICWDCCACELR